MLLNSATQKLVMVLTSAKTTYDLPVTVNYAETVTTPFSFSGKPIYTYTNGLTTVDVLAGVAGKELSIKKLSVYGKDTAAKGFRLGVVDFTSPVSAGAFTVGRPYQITVPGTTDFTLIGAANNNAGTIFDATGVGTGSGTASPFYQELDTVLQVDDTLCYDSQGWYTVDAQGNLKSVQAASATAIATAIHGAPDKATPVGTDEIAALDSTSGFSLIRVSFTNLLAWVNTQLGIVAPTAWTPNQGSGLTVVGAFTSSGTYTRVGKFGIYSGRVNGSTSVAVSAVGIITSNLPDTSALICVSGNAMNNAANAGGIAYSNGNNVYSVSAIPATATIYFTVVCITT